jgi:hypothetical protein
MTTKYTPKSNVKIFFTLKNNHEDGIYATAIVQQGPDIYVHYDTAHANTYASLSDIKGDIQIEITKRKSDVDICKMKPMIGINYNKKNTPLSELPILFTIDDVSETFVSGGARKIRKRRQSRKKRLRRKQSRRKQSKKRRIRN